MNPIAHIKGLLHGGKGQYYGFLRIATDINICGTPGYPNHCKIDTIHLNVFPQRIFVVRKHHLVYPFANYAHLALLSNIDIVDIATFH